MSSTSNRGKIPPLGDVIADDGKLQTCSKFINIEERTIIYVDGSVLGKEYVLNDGKTLRVFIPNDKPIGVCDMVVDKHIHSDVVHSDAIHSDDVNIVGYKNMVGNVLGKRRLKVVKPSDITVHRINDKKNHVKRRVKRRITTISTRSGRSESSH